MSSQPFTRSQAGAVYEVFAKAKPDEPLRQVGNVVAPDDRLAQVYAFTLYQEWAWSEMIIVPRTAVIPLVPAD